LSFIGAD